MPYRLETILCYFDVTFVNVSKLFKTDCDYFKNDEYISDFVLSCDI